ncbi:hypothetical protein JKP88DRAFT_249716 [Tribonema minus]|uniref:Uncharacterized protein n=1 Tax=Tribonema minus TaxID=303371 RepID=A0A835YM78_9STRA|nr:hypothetical protein JKP88DRAFT_249716 [Tribonema minus]
MPGVICISYDGGVRDVEKYFEAAVLTALPPPVRRTLSQTAPGVKLQAILAAYYGMLKHRAVFVVEVASLVTPEQLRNMLSAIKRLGFDEGLATFVVVLSATRSALGSNINLFAQRCRVFAAPDFSKEEACQYLESHLTVENDTLDMAEVVDRLGTRVGHLVDLCLLCDEEGAQTEQDVMRFVDRYRDKMIQHASSELNSFLHQAPIKSKKGNKVKGFLRRLLRSDDVLTITDAMEAFEFTTKYAVCRALVEGEALLVDLDTMAVKAHSVFMTEAIRAYIARPPCQKQKAATSAQRQTAKAKAPKHAQLPVSRAPKKRAADST